MALDFMPFPPYQVPPSTKQAFTCGLPPGAGDSCPLIGGGGDNHTEVTSVFVQFTKPFFIRYLRQTLVILI